MKPITQFMVQMRLIQNATKMPEIQAQQVICFLSVATQPDISMGALTRAMGTSGAACSRSIARLGIGESPDSPGLGLVEAFEDPWCRRRKQVRLTPKGKALAQRLDGIVSPAGTS